MNSLLIRINKTKVKIDKYDISLSMSENENCSRPSGTHPKKEATLSSNYAAKANAGVAVLKEAARRARGDVFASIVCPLITRRAAPIEHI